MKYKGFPLLPLTMFFIIVLTACTGGNAQLPVTNQPETDVPDMQVQATDAPDSNEGETEPTQVPTEPSSEPIELTGPPMEVGSKYLYVDGSVLIAIPAGEFIMGDGDDDNPEHTVYLDDFWIYRAPVTNQQYALCVAAGTCAPPDDKDNIVFEDPARANDPVVGVTWDQAAAYCTFVQARLPSEAEWEKTARGPDGNLHPWGDAAPSCELLNAANCVSTTTDVTTYPLGISYYEAFDTAGNVFEWVADWYSPTYYGQAPVENPFGPETGERRSIRSSSFSTIFYETDLPRRYRAKPDEHRADLGFRCVVEDPLAYAPYCEYVVVYGADASGLEPLGEPNINNTCPSLSIDQYEYCSDNNTPLTNVQFGVNPPGTSTTINAGSCSDLGGNTYLCNSADAISICANCSQTVNEDPSCPPGYHLDGLTCIPDLPLEGLCLPGFNYDPEKMCCNAQPGGLPGGSSPCLSGTYYFNPPGGCFAIPGAGTTCENDTVGFKKCGEENPGGDPGDDPGGCVDPPGCAPPPRCGVTGPPCCCP